MNVAARTNKADSGRRTPVRFFRTLLLGTGALGAALLLVAACLPDLAATAERLVPEAAPEPFVGCGDGVVATLDDGGDAGESCDPGKPGDVDARAPGCEACQIRCEGTLDPVTHHCYFAGGTDSDYNAARARCKAAGGHVVTFASAVEAALVSKIPSVAPGYWVGLSRSSTLNEAYGPDPSRAEEPGFPSPPLTGPCDGCFGLGADGGVFPVEDAAIPNPNCLAGRDGSWFQVGCAGTVRTTICEREPVGTRGQFCAGGFCFTLPATAGAKSYFVSNGVADADQAAASCAQLVGGGSLVVLGSAEEREQLAEQIAHETLARDTTLVSVELWIGLAKDGGAWTWEDGVVAKADASRPLPWGNAQPPAETVSSRAFMRLSTTAYDTQLVHADEGQAPRAYVCQRAEGGVFRR